MGNVDGWRWGTAEETNFTAGGHTQLPSTPDAHRLHSNFPCVLLPIVFPPFLFSNSSSKRILLFMH